MVRFALSVWEPSIDLYETKDHYIIIIELAGVKESDVEITIDNDTFTIRGKRKRSSGSMEKRVYYRMEISSGPFKRSIKLPDVIDTAHVNATHENGLIEVVLPKLRGSDSYKYKVQGS
jgi:HSP20 family protein